MKGLLKNNYFATLDNAKAITALMVLLCALGIVMKNQILLISFTLFCMVGFSLISLVGSLKERGFKWDKYKLSMPVRRAEIVRSYFLSLLLWLVFGMLLAGSGIGLSLVIRGFLFDKPTDVFNLYVGGIGVSLFAGAIFFPLYCSSGGEERGEALLVISLLLGFGIIAAISSFINSRIPTPLTARGTIAVGIMILSAAVFAFVFSYVLTIRIYRRRDC